MSGLKYSERGVLSMPVRSLEWVSFKMHSALEFVEIMIPCCDALYTRLLARDTSATRVGISMRKCT
jgi:hypothetical protein